MDIEEYSKYKQFYNEDIPKLLLKYLSKNNWNNYLDLGCGDGSLLNALNKKGYLKKKNVYAIDLSEKRINLVKKINPSFICYVEDACDVKNIQDRSIDFLVSSQVIEHVENDNDMVKGIYRLMRKNGIVYLSTVFKKKYGWYFYKCNNKWTLDPTHLREYDADNQLLDIFDKNSFKIMENKKVLVKRSLADFFLKRIGVDREVFIKHPFLMFIRNLKIPIFGYYNWEIVCQKK